LARPPAFIVFVHFSLSARRPVPVLFIPGIKYAVHVRRPKMRVALSFFHEFYALLCAPLQQQQQILFLPLFAGGRIFARNFNDRPMRQVFLRRTSASARKHTRTPAFSPKRLGI
jgi:hypothetical protein